MAFIITAREMIQQEKREWVEQHLLEQATAGEQVIPISLLACLRPRRFEAEHHRLA